MIFFYEQEEKSHPQIEEDFPAIVNSRIDEEGRKGFCTRAGGAQLAIASSFEPA